MTVLVGELLPVQYTPPRNQGHDVDGLVRRWLIGLRSPHTRRAFTVDIRQWLAYCSASGLDPTDARREHVEAWLRHMESWLSPETVRRRLTGVTSFYTWAVGEEYIHRHPSLRVRAPATDTNPAGRGRLTLPQLRELIRAADNDPHPYGARESLSIRLMALNGLRVGSVATATIGGLSPNPEIPGITVRTKGGKRQFTPFTESTVAALHRYLDVVSAGRGSSGTVAVGRGAREFSGAPLFLMYGKTAWASPDSLTYGLSRTAATSALPPEVAKAITPHWLRHTFVTLARAAGAELEHVQAAAGHSDLKTTVAYDGGARDLAHHPAHLLDGLL